jgi:hypothetical protein
MIRYMSTKFILVSVYTIISKKDSLIETNAFKNNLIRIKKVFLLKIQH